MAALMPDEKCRILVAIFLFSSVKRCRLKSGNKSAAGAPLSVVFVSQKVLSYALTKAQLYDAGVKSDKYDQIMICHGAFGRSSLPDAFNSVSLYRPTEHEL